MAFRSLREPSRRRAAAGLGAAVLAAALLAAAGLVGLGDVTGGVPAVGAASRVDTNRLFGADRYETAAEIAEEFAASVGSVDTVIVASGRGFADALAAAPLANVLDSPILLTPPDELARPVRDFIERHAVRDVIILGGRNAVSGEVEDTLAQVTRRTPRRLAGADRYRTVTNIANELDIDEIGDYCGDGRRTALVATGENFADALALSPLAFAGPHPVLLSRPDQLPRSVEEFIGDYEIEQVVMAGGPAALSGEVETALIDLGVAVQRLWGRDRFETAAEIAQALSERCFGNDEFGLADGRKFPDALAGGTVLGTRRAPLLLSAPTLPDSTRKFLAGRIPDAGTVELTILGGPAAVAPSTAAVASDALMGLTRDCDPRFDAPGVPRQVSVAPLSGALEVHWRPPAIVDGAAPTGYRIRHRPVGGQWTVVRDAASPAAIDGLRGATLYEVQVQADGDGYGVWSPSAFAAPQGTAATAAAAATNATTAAATAAATAAYRRSSASVATFAASLLQFVAAQPASRDCPPAPTSA